MNKVFVLFVSCLMIAGCPGNSVLVELDGSEADGEFVSDGSRDAARDALTILDGRADASATADASDSSDASAVADASDAPTSDVPTAPGPCFGGLHYRDLIKGSGPATYYLATDCRRYVFPNEITYKSWYVGYTDIQTIPDATLAAIPIGGIVTVRPGTWSLKITTSPRVYAVSTGGVLHWIESETIMAQLYGSEWQRHIHDVPDAFFVNYSVGTSISTAVHPQGTLIVYPPATEVYVVDHGERRLLMPGAFEANRFQTQFLAPTTVAYTDGPPVYGYEPALSDTIYVP